MSAASVTGRGASRAESVATADALRLLTPEELRALHALPPGRLALRGALEWALVLGSLWLWARTGHPAVWILAFVVIGTRQHCFINAVHESVHWGASRDKRWNDWISDLLFAAPCLLSTASFREGHLPHHRFLGQAERDTEVREWTQVSDGGLWRLLLHHFSGAAFVAAVFRYDPRARGGSRPAFLRYAGTVALTQSAILGWCVAVGAPFAYLHLWLYPLFSLALLLVTVLAVVQHQPVEYARLAALRRDVSFTPPLTRDTHATGPFERGLVAPIGAAYHLEHHLFPGVPYSRLGRLHRLLRARGFYAEPVEGAGSGYAALLRRLAAEGGRGAAPAGAAGERL